MFTYPSREGRAHGVARSCEMQAVSLLYLQTTYIGVCGGVLGGGGGTLWLLNESLIFKGPSALQTTAVNRIEVNKIPPNFDTLFATSL